MEISKNAASENAQDLEKKESAKLTEATQKSLGSLMNEISATAETNKEVKNVISETQEETTDSFETNELEKEISHSTKTANNFIKGWKPFTAKIKQDLEFSGNADKLIAQITAQTQQQFDSHLAIDSFSDELFS